MTAKNPFDSVLDETVQAMRDIHGGLAATFKDVVPFNSVQLSPEEDRLIYDNPIAHPAVAGQMDPGTGLPLTNAQAAAKLLETKGPEWYVSWVDDNVKHGAPVLDAPVIAPAPALGPPAAAAPMPTPGLPPVPVGGS